MKISEGEAISLGSDNHSGVHPQLLKAIININSGHSPAYGTDEYTMNVNQTLKSIFGRNCEPYFVFNGTAANVLCLSALTDSFDAIITADSAHLNIDECGAPEKAIGCKVLIVPSVDGKISPDGIDKHLIRLGDQHYAQPKAVSITLPTEYGTCYSIEELHLLRKYTREKNLFLHVDGARLIYAAHYLKTDLKSLTETIDADAISFGGTKNGLLFGEIVLLYNDLAKKKFKYIRKQSMQLPSKMRFLSAQFEELLKEPGLWREIASHGHNLALYLKMRLEDIPEIRITQNVEANSVFAKLPKSWIKPLREKFFFYVWDEKELVVRLMISFDITKNDIDNFVLLINDVKTRIPN